MRSDDALAERVRKLQAFASGIRASEYHVTNACNLRCEGCWFFAHGHDKVTREETNLRALDEFLDNETVVRRINTAILIGGEPSLFPDRLERYVDKFEKVTISTNGLRALPHQGFEDVTIAITLFGAGPIDDNLRAIKPSGKRFTGLFDTALKHYRNDNRAGFVIALSDGCDEHIEDTVRKIQDNGNRCVFNFYSKYGADDPAGLSERQRVLDAALYTKEKFPGAVISHPFYIKTLIEGKTEWGEFGYKVCPSISVDYPENFERLKNGNRYLTRFNTWAADLKSLKLCCTSGECNSCRDSQAILSWLLVSIEHFCDSSEMLQTWVEVAESYWSQFTFSPYHVRNKLHRDAS